jgi:hypothetical protein
MTFQIKAVQKFRILVYVTRSTKFSYIDYTSSSIHLTRCLLLVLFIAFPHLILFFIMKYNYLWCVQFFSGTHLRLGRPKGALFRSEKISHRFGFELQTSWLAGECTNHYATGLSYLFYSSKIQDICQVFFKNIYPESVFV